MNNSNFFKKLQPLFEGSTAKAADTKTKTKTTSNKVPTQKMASNVKESDANFFRKYSDIIAEAEKEELPIEVDEEQIDEVGALSAMAVGAAIQGNHMDQSKLTANNMKNKAGVYAQAPAQKKFDPTVFNVPQSSAKGMMNKARGMSDR